MIQMMATLSVWFLFACLFDLLVGLIAIDESRYVRTGTDETLSCSMRGIVQTAAWLYCSNCDEDTKDSIYIASESDCFATYHCINRIVVVYDKNNGVYNLTLLNFNGQTDVGIYICDIKRWYSGPSRYYYSVEFADGPSTASIIGNVPVFADDSSSLSLTCDATANPGVSFHWKNGNKIIGYSNTLTLSPTREDNGATITCTAINREYDDIRVSVSVTLQVHLTHAEEKEQINLGAVIGETIAVVILVCVVVFLFMWKRRRSTKDKSDLEMSNSRRNRNILDPNPDEADRAENPMYVSTGHSPKTMDVMYSEVKKLKKTPPTQYSGEAVYAQVKTKGKVEGNDNVYSQVKKKGKVEDEDNVYSQVDKKLLRNKDGLTYAVLAFVKTNQQQAAQISHGLEDTTEYAAIDITKRGPTPPQTNVAKAATAKEDTHN